MWGKYATKIHQPRIAFDGECNTRVLVINKKGKIGMLDTWINLDIIARIIYIPQPGKDVYCIMYDTKVEWIVHNQEKIS